MIRMAWGLVWAIIIFTTGGCMEKVDVDIEKTIIKDVVENSIGWAMTKDKDLLYSCFAHDAELFWFTPEAGGTLVGFESFTKTVDDVFMNDAFKAVRFDTKDMVITISQDGSCAWYHCILNDINEWNGQKFSWENVRWTGVLEKRGGNWLIVQMHFSNSVEDIQQRTESKG